MIQRPTLSIVYLGVIGSLGFIVLPLMVGGFEDQLDFSGQTLGLLASGDTLGMFLAAGWQSFRGRHVAWSGSAITSLLTIILANAASCVATGLTPLFLLRAASGFAGGTLMALAMAEIATTRYPARWIAVLGSAQVAIGSAATALLPDVMRTAGLAAVFGVLIATAVTGLAVARQWSPRQENEAAASQAGAAPISVQVAAVVAIFLLHIPIASTWAYADRIGHASSLAPQLIGSILSLSLLANIAGGALAFLMPSRIDRRLPLTLALILQLIAQGMLFGEVTSTTFTAGLVMWAVGLGLGVPLWLAACGTIPSGLPMMVVCLLVFKAAYAAAPIAVAPLVAAWGYPATSIIAIACSMVGYLLIVLAVLPAQGAIQSSSRSS